MKLHAARKTEPPESPVTVCARWLKYVIRKDPSFKVDIGDLLSEFAEMEGFSLAELDRQFHEEEVFWEAERVRALEKKIKRGGQSGKPSSLLSHLTLPL